MDKQQRQKLNNFFRQVYEIIINHNPEAQRFSDKQGRIVVKTRNKKIVFRDFGGAKRDLGQLIKDNKEQFGQYSSDIWAIWDFARNLRDGLETSTSLSEKDEIFERLSKLQTLLEHEELLNYGFLHVLTGFAVEFVPNLLPVLVEDFGITDLEQRMDCVFYQSGSSKNPYVCYPNSTAFDICISELKKTESFACSFPDSLFDMAKIFADNGKDLNGSLLLYHMIYTEDSSSYPCSLTYERIRKAIAFLEELGVSNVVPQSVFYSNRLADYILRTTNRLEPDFARKEAGELFYSLLQKNLVCDLITADRQSFDIQRQIIMTSFLVDFCVKTLINKASGKTINLQGERLFTYLFQEEFTDKNSGENSLATKYLRAIDYLFNEVKYPIEQLNILANNGYYTTFPEYTEYLATHVKRIFKNLDILQKFRMNVLRQPLKSSKNNDFLFDVSIH